MYMYGGEQDKAGDQNTTENWCILKILKFYPEKPCSDAS